MQFITRIALYFLILLVASPAFAQEEKPIAIGILRSDSQRNIPENVDRAIEQFIYTKFTSQKRFRILERARFNAVNTERAFQDFNDVRSQTAIRNIGADYVVFSEVTQADVVRNVTDQGGVYYTATVAYGLRVIDVSTGQIVHSASVSTGRGNPFAALGGMFSGDTSTPAGAIDIALQQTGKDLDKFIGVAFPVLGLVVSVESVDKKGLPTNVLVSLGAVHGVTKKSKFNAFQSQTLNVGGKSVMRKKPVAVLQFLRSEGDGLTLCKVVSGGVELAALISSGSLSVEMIP